METRLFEESQIPEIVKLLENGEVVGIPTDTVYGIACKMDDVNVQTEMSLSLFIK